VELAKNFAYRFAKQSVEKRLSVDRPIGQSALAAALDRQALPVVVASLV